MAIKRHASNFSSLRQNLPVEVHFHGLEEIDFSRNLDNLDLLSIQKLLEEEGILAIPTIFVSQRKLSSFLRVMDKFHNLKRSGQLQNMLGISLEGPILLSKGGTPKEGSWKPTWKEWQKIAECGEKGLKYMVISPDWNQKQLEKIAKLFLSHGVYLSLGHIRRNAVRDAVKGIKIVANLASKMDFDQYSGAISVDHFLNDMPQNIKHAWRSSSERRLRSKEINAIATHKWKFSSLDKQIGLVPATLMKFARKGSIILFINFDGWHVDLQICRRIYEMIGADGIIAMTDRVETNTLGKTHIKKGNIGTLWYRPNGVVAAGSSTLFEQMANMRALKIPEKDILKMCITNPNKMFS